MKKSCIIKSAEPPIESSKNRGFSSFYPILNDLIRLFKCFNQLHSPALKDQFNVNCLEMTEAAKTAVLGAISSKIEESTENTDHSTNQSHKFVYNTYDTICQLLGLF